LLSSSNTLSTYLAIAAFVVFLIQS